MRCSQEQLTAKLLQCQIELDQAKTQYDQTKAQLDHTKSELDCTLNRAVHLQAQLDQSQSELLHNKTQLEQSRTQNSHLHAQLDQLSVQLNQARVQAAQLQAQLKASEKSMETSTESLLIKVEFVRVKVVSLKCIQRFYQFMFMSSPQESEVTRLQARISGLERAAEHQNLYKQTLSLPALHKFAHSPERSSSAHSPPHSPKKLQSPACSDAHSFSTRSPVTQTCPPPPAHINLQPTSVHRDFGIDSSLDLPLSLKATLKEALSKEPWESSSSSISPFTSVNHSWQGLTSAEATTTSDLSFNPLTYMVDKPDDASVREGDDEWMSESRRVSERTLVGEEETDVSSLTGMLRFVNQTLAMQEDPSLWLPKT